MASVSLWLKCLQILRLSWCLVEETHRVPSWHCEKSLTAPSSPSHRRLYGIVGSFRLGKTFESIEPDELIVVVECSVLGTPLPLHQRRLVLHLPTSVFIKLSNQGKSILSSSLSAGGADQTMKLASLLKFFVDNVNIFLVSNGWVSLSPSAS